jgi:hypothetical protein
VLSVNAVLNGLIALVGVGTLAAIGMRYPRSRMFTAPLAGIWLTFWVLQAAEAMGVSDRIHLIVVVMIAAAVATIVAVNIPHTIEDRQKNAGGARRLIGACLSHGLISTAMRQM